VQIAPRAINERRAFDMRAATSINDEPERPWDAPGRLAAT
jgi:hypothetical protein